MPEYPRQEKPWGTRPPSPNSRLKVAAKQTRNQVLINDVSPCRRLTTRIQTHGEVWAYWQCGRRADVSRVRNVSAGGMFLEIEQPLAKGQTANLHFLVQEGAIQADAVVRRFTPGEGLGLKFVAIEKDCGRQFAELLTRLRDIERSKN